MGRRPFTSIGPRPSITSPTRLNTRPSVSPPPGAKPPPGVSLAHGDGDRLARVPNPRPALHTVGGPQRDGPNAPAAQVLRDFAPQRLLGRFTKDGAGHFEFERIVDRRHSILGKLG